MDFLERLHARARERPARIVLPEGDEPRTLKAAVRARTAGLAEPTLLGEERAVRNAAQAVGVDLTGVRIEAVPEAGAEFEAALRTYELELLAWEYRRCHFEQPGEPPVPPT